VPEQSRSIRAVVLELQAATGQPLEFVRNWHYPFSPLQLEELTATVANELLRQTEGAQGALRGAPLSFLQGALPELRGQYHCLARTDCHSQRFSLH
jgi:hypothetical protein